MDRRSFVSPNEGHGAEVPLGARVLTTCLSMITISVLAICTVRRIQVVQNWSRLPIVSWIILAIYSDSLLFIFSTAILDKSWSVNDSHALCQAAILLCVACYMTTKILIYYFLSEKVYIIRGSTAKRLQDKLWCFNVFGVILPYIVLVVVNFVYRIGYINTEGVCIIGLEKKALFPLIGFDVVLNFWLTSLFLHPLYRLYSFRNNANPALRTVAIRTFVGSVATLVSSVVNLTVLASLRGEPGWVCLMLCNLDILFSVLILHWATSVDKQTTDKTAGAVAQYGNNGTVRMTQSKSHAPQGSLGGAVSNTIATRVAADDKDFDDIEKMAESPTKMAHVIKVETVHSVRHDVVVGPAAISDGELTSTPSEKS